MSRLIDADKLIEELKIKTVSKDAHIISIANAVVNLVNSQPTAFDTEKVVEQLEEKIEITWEHDYRGGRKDAFNEAIDIVKKGGVE